MKILLFKIGSFLSIFSFNKLNQAVLGALVYVYTGFMQNKFRSFGQTSVLGRNCFISGGKYITIGEKCTIHPRVILTAVSKWKNKQTFEPEIFIGDNVYIGYGCRLSAISKIRIENGTTLGSYVTIVDNSHGDTKGFQSDISPYDRILVSSGDVIINENVWIGDKATILPNVHIGKGAIIGANAVVTKDIPDYGIAVGIPAKVVGYNK